MDHLAASTAPPQEEDANPSKLFLGGLSYESTEDSVRSYFESQYGPVSDVHIVRERMTGVSRGFGFVTFVNAAVSTAVQSTEHSIDGRQVMARKATPKPEGGMGGRGMMGGRPSVPDLSMPADQVKAAPDYNPKKVFVGGVSHSVDEDAFKSYFMQFGEVLESWLMYDPQTSRPRGFGFVVFGTSEGLDSCCAINNHEIAGKFVEVKRATPRSANPPPNRQPQRPQQGGYGGGYGGGCGGYGGGMPQMGGMMGGYPNQCFGSMPGMNPMMGGCGMGGMGNMGGGMPGMGGMGMGGGYGAVGNGFGGGAGGYDSQSAQSCYGGSSYDTSGGYGAVGGGGGTGGGASTGTGYGAVRGAAAGARDQRSYTPY